MMLLRPAGERGHTQMDWLDSYHTFSFSDYYDKKHMNFGFLRVINEDWVQPGTGFGQHGHQDMEIITYVLEGALQHRDSMGNQSVIHAGEIQVMSAGTGIQHSEFNASQVDPVHFLQIWVRPEKMGLAPSYQQKALPAFPSTSTPWRLLASHDGREQSVSVHQYVSLFHAYLEPGQTVTYSSAPGRHTWLQLICGSVEVNGKPVSTGDGLGMEQEDITITAQETAEILLFDLLKPST